MDGMIQKGGIDSSRVFAEVGLSLKYLADKIKVSSVQQIDPENIYIMMGTNGIGWMTYDYMIDRYVEYVKSLEQAMPDARIYILSIPPVGREVEAKPADQGQILNEKVVEYNRRLDEMAADNGWYFVNVNPVLQDSNGYILESNDGLHMTNNLYSTFKNYLLTHIAY